MMKKINYASYVSFLVPTTTLHLHSFYKTKTILVFDF